MDSRSSTGGFSFTHQVNARSALSQEIRYRDTPSPPVTTSLGNGIDDDHDNNYNEEEDELLNSVRNAANDEASSGQSASGYISVMLFNSSHATIDVALLTQIASLFLNSPHGLSPFLMNYIKGVLDASLQQMREEIYSDVHNMHIDMLRQFHLQQIHVEELLQKKEEREAALAQRIRELEQENQNLRALY